MFPLPADISGLSGPSRLRELFEATLVYYQQQTGVDLAKHTLADRLRDCNSVEDVATVLSEQSKDFENFWEKDRVLKPLKKVLTVLRLVSSAPGIAEHVGLPVGLVKAIQTGLGVLLSAVKDVIADYDALAKLLESIGHFLNRLTIYTEIPSTDAMDEMVVKILVDLLSTLALATKEINRGRFKTFVEMLVGEKKMEAMVQRLDQLTQDEARLVVAQILKIVYDAFGTMHQIASDLTKSKHEPFFHVAMSGIGPVRGLVPMTGGQPLPSGFCGPPMHQMVGPGPMGPMHAISPGPPGMGHGPPMGVINPQQMAQSQALYQGQYRPALMNPQMSAHKGNPNVPIPPPLDSQSQARLPGPRRPVPNRVPGPLVPAQSAPGPGPGPIGGLSSFDMFGSTAAGDYNFGPDGLSDGGLSDMELWFDRLQLQDSQPPKGIGSPLPPLGQPMSGPPMAPKKEGEELNATLNPAAFVPTPGPLHNSAPPMNPQRPPTANAPIHTPAPPPSSPPGPPGPMGDLSSFDMFGTTAEDFDFGPGGLSDMELWLDQFQDPIDIDMK